MKKLFTYVAVAIASVGISFGQMDTTGGPDNFGYSWMTSDDLSGSVTYNWIDISSTGTQVTGFSDDNILGPYAMGFDFPFYWYDVNQFSIGSNGYIHFADVPFNISSENYGASADQSFPGFPYNDPQGNANNMVAPLLCDLNPGPIPAGSEKVYYYTNNTDTVIISYENVGFWSAGTAASGQNTFQVILSGVDSSITFQYKTQSGSWASSYDAAPNPCVIGIESKAGQSGLTVSDGVKPYDNLAIRFTVQKDPTFSLTDVALDWQKNNLNGATFGVIGNPTFINVNVTNTGDSDINASVDVSTEIKRYNKGQLASTNIFSPASGNNFSLSSLAAGVSNEYTYNEALVPDNALNKGEPGTYTISSSLTFGADGVSDNNSVETEYIILDDTFLDSLAMNYYNVPDLTQGEQVGVFGFGSGGIYVDLPFYPVTLKELHMYISTDGNPPSNGMFLKVYARDADGGVGDLIYDTYVTAGLMQYPAAATDPMLPTIIDVDDESTDVDDIVINDKGFYYSFETEDDISSSNYAVFEDLNGPFSLRTFEVQGGTWGSYRGASAGDMMLGAVVDGSNAVTGITKAQLKSFTLGDAYPNPTSGATNIQFSLEDASNARFTLSNVIGQKIEVKEFGKLNSGAHQVTVDAANLEAGIYFYSIEVGNKRITKKLIVR